MAREGISNRKARFAATMLLAVVGGALAMARPAFAEDPSGEAFFEKNIRPVLADNCYECHSVDADELKAGLRLDRPGSLMQEGNDDALVQPGDPDGSPLIAALRQEGPEMPPDGPLPDEVIADFAKWIEMGAPLPPDADDVDPTEGLWSLKPIADPAVPEVEDADWPRTDVDRYVLHRLEQEDLTPMPDADRWTLVRRVYYDITGLPPTPEQAEAFVRDDSPDALEKLVDRLLASPRFGEKWARHWLDVARYAESSGREFNFTYPDAWPYRDYVINAFNADKPYDQFVREQLAGDLIAAEEQPDWQRRDELHAATGFLAVGPKRHNAGKRIFTADIADDQIDTLSQAVLGLTVACARCHDHKFDPIPTEDYYALAGIFQSTRVLDGTIDQKYSRHPAQAIPMGAEGAAEHAAVEEHEAQLAELNKKLEQKQEAFEKAKKAAKEEADEEAAEDADEDAEESDSAGDVAKLEERVASLEQEIEDHEAAAPDPPDYTVAVEERDGPSDARLAIGGDLRNLGDPVPRGLLSAVPIEDAPEIPDDASGRVQLADWVTRPDNPLTARVLVNRVWSHLMGRGIVDTVDNFGKLGREPTHPALLDHLATRFMDEGWSIKQLVRQIVLSRTYGLSTARESTRHAADPENKLYWRATPRRLQAEQLRDGMLAASGQLDLTPPDGSPITALGTQMARQIAQEKMTPPNVHRSVYQPIVRDYVPEMLQLFDFAAPSLVIGERSETTVPDQALYMLNSDFAIDQAEHAARRVTEADVEDDKRVDLAYRLILNRPATPQEREEGLAFVADVGADPSDEADEAHPGWTALCQALLASTEFRYLLDVPEQAATDATALPEEALSQGAKP